MSFDKLFDQRKRNAQTSKQSDTQTSESETAPSSEDSEVKSQVQTSEHLNVQTSSKLDTQTSNAKSKNKEYTRTTFYLPKKTHQRLKIASINQQEEMSEIVTRLIENWLEDSDA
ncbi:MAG: hypothetical protein GVY17_09935 [Cyanobacteria bacterium]|jgi:hypothetical protein|nr:hypothetical protein [Cyanobacteria bacterium GSL.Bin21]